MVQFSSRGPKKVVLRGKRRGKHRGKRSGKGHGKETFTDCRLCGYEINMAHSIMQFILNLWETRTDNTVQ